MRIQHITTRIPANQMGDLDDDRRVIITVDDCGEVDGEARFFEITVDGYGTADYRLTVRGTHTDVKNLPCAQTSGEAFWGVALVWASPDTIARVVMDVINNQ